MSNIGGTAEMIMKYSDGDLDLFNFFIDANTITDLKLCNPYSFEIYKFLANVSFKKSESVNEKKKKDLLC